MAKYTVKFYDKSGQLLTKESNDCVAKQSTNDDTQKTRYYIKFSSGSLVDPKENSFDRNKKNFKFREIKEDVFNSYMKYLTKGGISYFRTAERGVLNG